MQFIEFQRELDKLGLVVFTTKDAARITDKPSDYCKVFLHRWVTRGLIQRIERQKYCTNSATIYEIASNLVFPSYVSFLAALSYHGLATQIPIDIQVACTVRKRPIEIQDYRISFVKQPREWMFGYVRRDSAYIAEPEKAILDCVRLPDRVPLSEAAYAIKEGVDAQKLIEYANRTGSSVVKKRIGHLLELAGQNTDRLGPMARGYDFLNPMLPKTGVRNKRWRLVINEEIE